MIEITHAVPRAFGDQREFQQPKLFQRLRKACHVGVPGVVDLLQHGPVFIALHRITVYVNGTPLTIDDVPGTSHADQRRLPAAGNVSLRFTIAQGTKTPKYPGIVLKVGGKVVGRPMLFRLDENDQIPLKLLKRIYGEVEVDALEDQVTADWGAVLENSNALQEVKAWVHGQAYEALNAAYKRDMDLQKARLQRQINQRLEKLPEHRRAFAEAAIFRVLQKFYGEREDRIDTIASVMLEPPRPPVFVDERRTHLFLVRKTQALVQKPERSPCAESSTRSGSGTFSRSSRAASSRSLSMSRTVRLPSVHKARRGKARELADPLAPLDPPPVLR